MALTYAGISWNHREVLLRDIPVTLLDVSPKGTVPVMITSKGTVIDESLDIMLWALAQTDSDDWISDPHEAWIHRFEDEFKGHLDRYKYPNRYTDVDPLFHRSKCEEFLTAFDLILKQRNKTQLMDIAVFPFVRQFANHDRTWFDNLEFELLHEWLDGHLSSDLFTSIMNKHTTWTPEV